MIRRLLVAAAISAACSSNAMAADSSNGCGVGWYILKDNSLLSSYSRMATNSSLPNTFSMTSGTSGCAKHSIVQNDKRSLHFTESNLDALRVDAARGEGEYLSAFADTMGCSWKALPAFKTVIQTNYDSVFDVTQPQAVIDAALFEIQRHPELASQCQSA